MLSRSSRLTASMNATRLLPILLAVTSLALSACGEESESSAESAVEACHELCEVQRDAGCEVDFLISCEALCDSSIEEMKSDCHAKAQASFECHIEHNEDCVDSPSCAEEREAVDMCNS